MLTFDMDSIILFVVKAIRTIFAYLLVLTFLVPATGFYYTKHSCLKSGEVQLVLDGDYSCCATTEESNCCINNVIEQESSCCNSKSSNQEGKDEICSINNSTSECCTNEGHYLKSEEKFTSPGKTEMSKLKILFTASLCSIELLPVQFKTIEENAHSPPFTISSIDLLHRYSVLII